MIGKMRGRKWGTDFAMIYKSTYLRRHLIEFLKKPIPPLILKFQILIIALHPRLIFPRFHPLKRAGRYHLDSRLSRMQFWPTRILRGWKGDISERGLKR